MPTDAAQVWKAYKSNLQNTVRTYMMMMIPLPPMLPTDKKLYGPCPPLSIATSRAPAPPAAAATGPKKGLGFCPACLEVKSGDKRSWKIE